MFQQIKDGIRTRMLNSFNQNGRYVIPLVCNAQASLEHNGLCHVAVPLPIGLVSSLSHLKLVNNALPLNCNAKVTSYWQDKSIKWLTLNFFSSDKNNHYSLIINDSETENATQLAGINTCLKDNVFTINTNNSIFSFDINTSRFKWTCQKTGNDIENGYLELLTKQDKILNSKVTRQQCESFYNLADNSVQKVALHVSLEHHNISENISLNSTLVFTIYNNPSLLNIEHRLHNPKAANHRNGHWDLGDENSILFHSARIGFDLAEINSVELKQHENDQWHDFPTRSFTLQQFSSGGESWQSPVHVDKNNVITVVQQGAELTGADERVSSVARALPGIMINGQLSLTMEQFWQNFPKSLAVNSNRIIFELFPAAEHYHELQGGESKTHTLWLCQDSEKDILSWVHSKTRLYVPNEWMQLASDCQVGIGDENSNNLKYLVQAAIDGADSFFEKREIIDEYGWRNFGDLYADHETAYYTGKDLFVSHYNNQYDPIFGFLKQYLISGDNRWFELADDLAKHVKNIDIYHTTEDKAEYNGGLFWHTDHYLPAFTSSHRSYSKHQDSNAYQDHAGGGGPGGQHCYTTGLMLHYQLTGTESSKQAVLTLSSWITCVYEGTNTCLELLLALKNRHVAGTKNQFTGQYPLDRGTANYIIALLDSFELTQERHYLTQVEHIISHTVHPNEDIDLRNLDDVENTWFYTVFLQAVCRYLLVKQQMKELDPNFYFARDCLLNFTNWMVKHEYMYLDKPDILEYPNDTWTAQDLRKATIFAAAYYFSPLSERVYLDKAEYFENEVVSRLNSSASKTYTRIMVLVLQNCGLVGFYKNLPKQVGLNNYQQNWPASYYANRGLFMSFSKVALKRLMSLSLKNEINWLKKRLK
ncbi:hypothetical protein [Paraglaciecola sp.]|uniref:hypothetical protein n=1 Tax=Paraglaciecola sp. TaxID=1920173 RepID=UPI0030F3C5D0